MIPVPTNVTLMVTPSKIKSNYIHTLEVINAGIHNTSYKMDKPFDSLVMTKVVSSAFPLWRRYLSFSKQENCYGEEFQVAKCNISNFHENPRSLKVSLRRA